MAGAMHIFCTLSHLSGYLKGDVRFGKSSSSFFVQTLRMVQGIMSENIFEKFAVFTEIFAFK